MEEVRERQESIYKENSIAELPVVRVSAFGAFLSGGKTCLQQHPSRFRVSAAAGAVGRHAHQKRGHVLFLDIPGCHI